LGALGNNFSIDNDHGTAIIIKSIAVASLLVGVEIDASALKIVSMNVDMTRGEEFTNLVA
jgi:hypothetical protein